MPEKQKIDLETKANTGVVVAVVVSVVAILASIFLLVIGLISA